MKATNLTLIVALALVGGSASFAQNSKPADTKASQKMECKDCKPAGNATGKRDACAVPMTLSLKGLHCEGCEANVKGKLSAISGVEEVSVSAKKQQAVVWVCPKKDVKPDALKAAVKKAGYSVVKIAKGEPKKS